MSSSLNTLTKREIHVLGFLAEGLTNREIAERLFLSRSTVKWYVRQLNSKLGTTNRSEIVEQARGLGILSTDQSEPSPRQHNLPYQTTPFVGREAELEVLLSLLSRPKTRLVTVLGPGGMGKTRLALETAKQQTSNFKDGVYFVPLQAVAESARIVNAIAEHTGYQFQNDGREMQQQVLDYLDNKEMLLLIDNWEHLLAGASIISTILQTAPEVKVLATSREKLNLSSETVYSLRGMRFPTFPSPEDALEYDAVQLLVHTAKRVKTDWKLGVDNLDDVARVCQLTSGMPLGIVLATKWLDALSLEQIAIEIEKNIDFLETEMRDLPSRQRSIRAIFEQVWRELSHSEQQAFVKLSVFCAGFTFDAAQVVAGADTRMVQVLVNKALISRSHANRYSTHELLRQYAQEKLEEDGIYEVTRQTHMAYYADKLQKLAAQVQDHRQLAALAEIEVDFENIRAAWFWAIQHQVEALSQMGLAINLFANSRGHLQEAVDLHDAAVRGISAQSDKDNRVLLARLLTFQAFALILTNQHDQTEALLRQSLKIARELNDPKWIASCLWGIGWTLREQGRQTEAQFLLDQSLRLSRKLDDQWQVTWALMTASLCAIDLGQMQQAQDHLLESLQIARKVKDKFGVASALFRLANFAFMNGDWLEAEQLNNESLVLARELDSTGWIALRLASGGDYALARGDFALAELYAKECQALARQTAAPLLELSTLLLFSRLADAVGDYELAHDRVQNALVQAESGRNQLLINVTRGQLAWVLCNQRQYDDAVSHLRFHLELAMQQHAIPLIIYDVAVSTHILAFKNEFVWAVELLGLVFEHRASPVGLLEKHPRFTELRRTLKSEIGATAYDVAWQRGRALELERVAQQLLEQLAL